MTDKMSYGTMVRARVNLLELCALSLARAVTIAVRYSVVRRDTLEGEE